MRVNMFSTFEVQDEADGYGLKDTRVQPHASL